LFIESVQGKTQVAPDHGTVVRNMTFAGRRFAAVVMPPSLRGIAIREDGKTGQDWGDSVGIECGIDWESDDGF